MGQTIAQRQLKVLAKIDAIQRDFPCCIADNCGMKFHQTVPENRPQDTLRPFWMRYCPKHRVMGKTYTAIVNQPVA